MASASTSAGEVDDWDRPFTDEELQAIDAAFLKAESTTTTSTTTSYSSPPIVKRRLPTGASDDSGAKTRRRLPESLFVFQQQNASSSSLSPCRRNRFHAYNSYQSSVYSSYRGNLVMRYQEMAFTGRIVYSRTFDEVQKSAEELLNFIEAKRRTEGHVVLGFDIEWRPTFRRGVAPGKAAVVQICGDNTLCYVLHICHSGIPQNLQHLLENPISVKVGVSIANDAVKIFEDHHVSVRALEDLSDLANLKLGDCKKWSLSALTEMLICKQCLKKYVWALKDAYSPCLCFKYFRMGSHYSRIQKKRYTASLPKPNKIRLGNWEADILSREQVKYAATDAFVSWYLYQVLKSLPEIANNKSEELAVLAA